MTIPVWFTPVVKVARLSEEESMAESGGQQGRGWVGWVQVGVIVLVVGVGIYFARAPLVPELDDAAARGAEAPTVRVLRPVASSHALTLALTGEVQPRNSVKLEPLASGRVEEVSPALRSGGTFKAGETLLVVDPEDARLALEQAQGALDSARGRLRRHQEQGALDAAEYRRLNPGREVPAVVAREPQIQRFQGRVRAAVASVALAERRLAHTRFSMPFDGTVIAASVAVGEVVGPGSVGTAFRSRDIETRVPIPVRDLAQIGEPKGRPATVVVGGQRFGAVVSGVAPVLARRTRLATLFLDFDEGAEEALPAPGAFARVTLRGHAFDGAFLLPDSAHRSGDSVWLVDDGKLRRATPNTLGRADAGWIVAAFDIADGIVVGAVPGERDGLSVTIAAEKAP